MKSPRPIKERFLLALATLCALSGCAAQTVQPWQKGTLARPEMTMDGDNPLLTKGTDHIYVSREAASGGAGVGGGGCGCN